MSTAFKTLKSILAVELLDGRLLRSGISVYPTGPDDEQKRLTDGQHNFLSVEISKSGMVDYFTANGGAARILSAIAETFDTDIVSEYEPQFWGFESEEEWDKACDKIGGKDQKEWYRDLLRWVSGEANRFTASTYRMLIANDVKRKVEANPKLIAVDKEQKLREMINLADGHHKKYLPLPDELESNTESILDLDGPTLH